MTTQQERLRSVAVTIRTKPTPLSDFIPLLNQTADHIDALEAELERLRKSAERYQWLRAQHWSDGLFAVVAHPKVNVRLGATAPSHELLDAAIDAAIKVSP